MTSDSLLLNADDAGFLCRVAGVTWRRWELEGLIPQGIKIGCAKRWRKSELVEWIGVGSPPRDKWLAIQAVSKRRAK